MREIVGGESLAPTPDAEAVIGLCRALGRSPAEVCPELALVAAWARLSPDRIAARHIRAENWPEGRNQSRFVAPLTRADRWAERLAAARAWDRAGRPTAAPASTAAGSSAPRSSVADMGDRVLARLRGRTEAVVLDVEPTPRLTG